MDTAELSGLLKRLCKICWAANVTNPITYVTQISYLIFLKMLEEWDAQAEQDARDLGQPQRSLFEGEYEALRWSRFSSDIALALLCLWFAWMWATHWSTPTRMASE